MANLATDTTSNSRTSSNFTFTLVDNHETTTVAPQGSGSGIATVTIGVGEVVESESVRLNVTETTTNLSTYVYIDVYQPTIEINLPTGTTVAQGSTQVVDATLRSGIETDVIINEAFTWSLTRASGTVSAGTGVNNSGVLTIGANETLGILRLVASGRGLMASVDIAVVPSLVIESSTRVIQGQMVAPTVRFENYLPANANFEWNFAGYEVGEDTTAGSTIVMAGVWFDEADISIHETETLGPLTIEVRDTISGAQASIVIDVVHHLVIKYEGSIIVSPITLQPGQSVRLDASVGGTSNTRFEWNFAGQPMGAATAAGSTINASLWWGAASINIHETEALGPLTIEVTDTVSELSTSVVINVVPLLIVGGSSSVEQGDTGWIGVWSSNGVEIDVEWNFAGYEVGEPTTAGSELSGEWCDFDICSVDIYVDETETLGPLTIEITDTISGAEASIVINVVAATPTTPPPPPPPPGLVVDRNQITLAPGQSSGWIEVWSSDESEINLEWNFAGYEVGEATAAGSELRENWCDSDICSIGIQIHEDEAEGPLTIEIRDTLNNWNVSFVINVVQPAIVVSSGGSVVEAPVNVAQGQSMMFFAELVGASSSDFSWNFAGQGNSTAAGSTINSSWWGPATINISATQALGPLIVTVTDYNNEINTSITINVVAAQTLEVNVDSEGAVENSQTELPDGYEAENSFTTQENSNEAEVIPNENDLPNYTEESINEQNTHPKINNDSDE